MTNGCHEGTIGIPLKDGSRKTARYWVKAFEEKNEGGIDGGKISKLSIRIDGVWVASYDSGWDVEPADDDEAAQLACGILINEYN